MEEKEYYSELAEIESAYETKKKDLYLRYAKSKEIYKIGDIIKDSIWAFKIDKITSWIYFGLPAPVYHGFELKKDLTPKLNKNRCSIFGNEGTELINN